MEVEGRREVGRAKEGRRREEEIGSERRVGEAGERARVGGGVQWEVPKLGYYCFLQDYR